MSEYWKSTPKYWCKHCSTYVKDTKFERAQHEATGKHQGNIRRFLKSIQDGHERGEREKQRARAEVERLNKVVAGSPASPSDYNAATSRNPAPPSATPQASVAERKKQLAQLAEMGIAVPDEFRGEMAMAGDWKVISQRPVEETTSEDSLSVGVRKRKYEGQEEEEEAGEVLARRGWGSTSKRYPGANGADTPNLDALLSGVKSVKKEDPALDVKEEIKEEPMVTASEQSLNVGTSGIGAPEGTNLPPIKKEESTGPSESVPRPLQGIPMAEESLGTGVVFKKRKPKSTREK